MFRPISVLGLFLALGCGTSSSLDDGNAGDSGGAGGSDDDLAGSGGQPHADSGVGTGATGGHGGAGSSSPDAGSAGAAGLPSAGSGSAGVAAVDAGPGPRDAGAPNIAGCLERAVSWGLDGGFVPFRDRFAINPCRMFTLERKSLGQPGSDAMCANEVQEGSAITVDDVDAALARPDVVTAFSHAPLLFGIDSRPVDGAVFQIELDGAMIEVGGECGASMCNPISDGVAELRTLLLELSDQQRALPDCDQVP